MTVNEMLACGWLRGMRALTAEEVKTLPVGTRLLLIGPDTHGEKSWKEGVIEQLGNARSRRFCFETAEGLMRKMIRDYPGKVWAVREKMING